MPSSGYVADTFVANEQPTTSKWNELWGNDASFNSGAGFNDSIIAARHMAANAVKSTALALSNALDGTNGVQTFVNAGTAGGTFFYINAGGLKLLWGSTGTISTAGTGNVQSSGAGITFPASFFSTIQSAMSNAYPSFVNSAFCVSTITAISASAATVTLDQIVGTNAQGTVSLFVIGT